MLWKVGVPVAALLGGAVAAMCVILVGLTTSMVVVWPLALGIGAAFAGLAAAWVGNLSSPDGTRSRLSLVLLVSEAGAVVAVLLAFALTAWAPSTPLAAPVALFVVAAAASAATRRFRGERGRLGRDGVAALVLSAVGVIALFATSPGGSWVLEGAGVLPPEGLLAGSAGRAVMLFVSLVFTSLGALVAIRRSRNPGFGLGRDAGVTLGVIGLTAPVFQGTLYVVCLAGFCGAV